MSSLRPGLFVAVLMIHLGASAAEQPQPPEGRVNARDNEVLLVVLESLLADGKNDPFVPSADPRRPVHVDMVPNCYPLTVEQVLERHDKKKWAALTALELASVREAAEHLVARTTTCSGEFAVSHPRLRLRRGDAEEAGFESSPCPRHETPERAIW